MTCEEIQKEYDRLYKLGLARQIITKDDRIISVLTLGWPKFKETIRIEDQEDGIAAVTEDGKYGVKVTNGVYKSHSEAELNLYAAHHVAYACRYIWGDIKGEKIKPQDMFLYNIKISTGGQDNSPYPTPDRYHYDDGSRLPWKGTLSEALRLISDKYTEGANLGRFGSGYCTASLTLVMDDSVEEYLHGPKTN